MNTLVAAPAVVDVFKKKQKAGYENKLSQSSKKSLGNNIMHFISLTGMPESSVILFDTKEDAYSFVKEVLATGNSVQDAVPLIAANRNINIYDNSSIG